MKRSLVLFLAVLLSPTLLVHSEIIASEGTAKTYVDIKGAGYECQAAADDMCKPGLPCFVRIYVEGKAARVLYEAMKLHRAKIDEYSGGEYFGTQADAMTCYEIDGDYSCNIGYDAVANVLTKIEISECE